MDLILAHRRAMKLAELCGLILSSQTKFATAVSEIARCSIANGKESVLVLGIGFLRGGKKEITAIINDKVNLQDTNPEAFDYALRLVKNLETSVVDGIFVSTLNIQVPYSGLLSENRIAGFIEYFRREIPLSAYEEIRKKNIQLIELSEKLSESENNYRRLTDTLPLIVFSVSNTGEVTLSNRKVKEIFGSQFNMFSTATFNSLFHSDDCSNIANGWTTARNKSVTFTTQARVKVKDNYLWYLVSFVPNKDDSGDATGWIISMVDINAQKLVEETLKDNKELKLAQEKLKISNEELSRKNKELEQFAYIASHDLQEPLRKIRNFTSLAERHLSEEEKEKLYFNKINLSAERMSRLINEVLNYSRITVKENGFSTVNLNSTLTDVLNDLEFVIQEKAAQLHIDTLPSVTGIPVQISQLFYNLVGNSLKFVNGQPIVKITSQLMSDSTGNQQFHKISIKDNGIGIEGEYIPKIFTIFKRLHHQNEYEGTGIGLALCKKIVETHGGNISISSIVNEGTTVDIFLPADSLN
jgi:PAS domain S-box-containing protein